MHRLGMGWRGRCWHRSRRARTQSQAPLQLHQNIKQLVVHLAWELASMPVQSSTLWPVMVCSSRAAHGSTRPAVDCLGPVECWTGSGSLTCKGLAKEEQRLPAVPAAGKGQVHPKSRGNKDAK